MDSDRVIHLVRLARSIEAGGHYNLSKILWSLAYADEIAASNRAGMLRGADLNDALSDVIAELKASGASVDLMTVLEQGVDNLRSEQHGYLSPIFVSRTTGDIYVGERPTATPGHDDPLDLREFSPIYYLDPLLPVDIIAALRTFPATISGVIEGLTDEQLTATPIPGEWSIKALLTHLDVAQGLLFSRAQQILNEDNPILMGVSAWLLTDSAISVKEIYDHYLSIRAQVLDLLTSLPAEQWWRSARHNEFGAMTLQTHVSYFTRHERSHLPQLMQWVDAVQPPASRAGS